MSRETIVLMMLVCLTVAPAFASEPGGMTEQAFPVPLGGTLTLSVPDTMQAETSSQGSERLDLRITPREGQGFELLVSATRISSADQPLSTPEEIQAAVRYQGTRLLETAVETELRVVKLSGEHGVAFLYQITDKREALPADEYRYLYQGMMLLGDLRLAVSFLTESTDEATVMPFLEILRTAKPE